MTENERMLKVLKFVDRNGTVLMKHGTPMTAELRMEFKKDNFKIRMYVSSHAMGTGRCEAEAFVGKKVVYRANGTYSYTPYDVHEQVYKPGDWEKCL